MKILTIGDIVSKQGCEYLRSTLPALKRELEADIVIANGENSAVGNGILPQSAEYILDCGVDLITLGNHSLKRKEIYDYLDLPSYVYKYDQHPLNQLFWDALTVQSGDFLIQSGPHKQ